MIDAQQSAVKTALQSFLRIRELRSCCHAKGADLLVTETSSSQGRMQEMLEDGRWQAMSPAEQAGITRQMTQGHMTLDEIGELAARANVKTVVLSHLTHKRDGDYTSWAEEVRKYFSGQVLVAKDLMEF